MTATHQTLTAFVLVLDNLPGLLVDPRRSSELATEDMSAGVVQPKADSRFIGKIRD